MNPMRSTRPWSWYAVVLAILLVSCLCLSLLSGRVFSSVEIIMPEHEMEKGQDYQDFIARQEEFKAPAEPIRRATTVTPGDTVYAILLRNGIPQSQSRSILEDTKEVFDLSKVLPGHELVLVFSPDNTELIGLEYGISDTSRLVVTVDGTSVQAGTRRAGIPSGLRRGSGRIVQQELGVRYDRSEGAISSSLYESAVQAGLPPEIVMGLTDIFACDINFFTDIREGDSYTVLYERYYVQDTFKGYGRIIAARILNRGEEHVAVYYSDGKSAGGYYDESGNPVKKLFLKTPFNYRRISPELSSHGMHPVSKGRASHPGVDFAAPSGTPVVALGQGEVIYKGWSKVFGKCLQIRHPSGHVSYYGHLSGFPKGISEGRTVEQGEVIGYVGMTGLATTPHLDFRIRLEGDFINPLTLKPVSGPALDGSTLARFREHWTKNLAMLDDTSLNYTMKLSTRN